MYMAVSAERGLTIENELGTTYYKANEATVVGYTRKPNKREHDGSKKDDTVAAYGSGAFPTFTKGFMGTTKAHARWVGSLDDLTSPYRYRGHLGFDYLGLDPDWETTGRGQLDQFFGYLQHDLNCHIREYTFERVGKDAMPMKSTFKAKVIDVDGTTHKDEYSIIWHMPQENHVQVNGTSGSSAELTGFEQISEGVRPTDARPGTKIYIKLKNPSATVKENGDLAVGITGVVLGIGGLAATIYLPAGYGWVPPLMADVIGPAIGVGWEYFSPAPLPDEDCDTDFGVFEKAVSEQKIINRCLRDNTDFPDNIELPGVPRLDPPEDADIINSGNIWEWYRGQHGPFTVSATKAVGKVKVTYIADGYGADGYMGDVFPNKTIPHTQHKVVTFTKGRY
ncbi:MAG: hypothetical protein H8F28_27060 [Fibrella sp.]|nr:hypothetical protein [Armatimonadota bacterium]